MTTQAHIQRMIAGALPGRVFVPASFPGAGSLGEINAALGKLVQAGVLVRLGRRLYAVPGVSRLGVAIMPGAEAVARTVAEAEGATIGIHGAEAARRFGLSTQMAVQPIFLTTGASRTLRVGKLTIRLKHASARKMTLAGTPAGDALAALWYLGKDEVQPVVFKRIRQRLPAPEWEALCQVRSVMPGWMRYMLDDHLRQ